MTKPCLICSKDYACRTSKRKYCSPECYYKMKRLRGDRVHWTPEMRLKMSQRMKGSGNHQYGKTSVLKGKPRPDLQGEKHPNWNGGRSLSEGYVIIENIKDTAGEKVYEHRKVMESFLSRKLNTSEIIHHKNGNKSDNRIENLEVTNRSDHIKIHKGENYA